MEIDFDTANATSANIQTLIRNLSWGAGAGSGAQTFTLTLNDNDGTANSGDEDTTANFTMTLGNPPVLDLDGDDSSGTGSGGYAAAFTEGGGTVAIADADVSLTDADGGATIAAITVTLTNDQDGAAEGLSVSAAAQNALTGIAGATVITRQDTISITGATASLAEVQTFLQNVFYDNTSDAPGTTARVITVVTTDNDGLTSSSVTSTVSVAAVNDAPAFTGVDATPAFTEDGAAVVLDANAVIADAELDALNGGNGNYSGATLTLARNGGANAEDVFANNGLLGALSESGNLVYNGTTVGTVTTNSGGTLVLTFNASATSALVDSVLQNITYSNTSDTPPANVQINYAFSDGNTGTQGSGGAGSDTNDSITVGITASNDAPVIGSLDGDAPSGAPDTAIVFDVGGNATITDADSADFNTGVLTVSRTGALTGDFALNVANATSGGDGVIAAAETVAVGGTDIGTVTTDGQGGNNLVITFNTADATLARVQTLIQALTYQSSDTGAHGFTVSVSDGDGGISSNATVSLNVATPSSGGGGGSTPTDVWTGTDDTNEVADFSQPQTVDGGGGNDTLVISKPSTDIIVTFDQNGYHFTPQGGQSVTVSSVETIQLGDLTLKLDQSEQAKTVLFLYDVFFDRTPDLPGITGWTETFNTGASLREIAGSFVQSEEFSRRYSDGASNEDFLIALYSNGLQREPDEAGLTGWLEALNNGELSRSDIALAFAQSLEIELLFSDATQDGIYLIG